MIWVNYNDLTGLPKPGIMGIGSGKSSPAMAELFRLVKYYNLPRWLIIIIIHFLIWIWMIWIKIRYLKREMVKYHVVSIMCMMCWLVLWNHGIWWLSTWEFHHPNWRFVICFTGVGWNHQPEEYLRYVHENELWKFSPEGLYSLDFKRCTRWIWVR